MNRNGEIKDYYSLLEISSVATVAEIKKSYRRLAFKFHPDSNPDNQFAISMFREIQEAYSILSDANKRRKYDEERWLSGMGNRLRDRDRISVAWIHSECRKLHAHMTVVDTYRMDHNALYEYVSLILSDSNKAVLFAEGDRQANLGIAYLLLGASKNLRHPYMALVAQQLRLICEEDDNFIKKLEEQVMLSKRSSRNNKYMPVLVIVFALLLCVFMYFWAV